MDNTTNKPSEDTYRITICDGRNKVTIHQSQAPGPDLAIQRFFETVQRGKNPGEGFTILSTEKV